MRPAAITGDECPGGSSVRQIRFLPDPNSAGTPALSETPVPFGPRKRSHCPHAAPPSSTRRHTIRMPHHGIGAGCALALAAILERPPRFPKRAPSEAGREEEERGPQYKGRAIGKNKDGK